MERAESSFNTTVLQNFSSDYSAKSLAAAAKIEKAYLSYRDRQMFTLLKHAVRAAEQSWTLDVLRKISPNEANLLSDPSIKAKIRFRFAGREFPPVILFKIYLLSNGTKYISGKRAIRPATDAAVDACKLMGHRKFYDHMIIDACQFEKDKVTDLIDVTTVKDYMQYLSNLDEMPCYLGGKENYWRHLSLEALPRQSIMYDVVEYLKTKAPSVRLRQELPLLLSRPVTQEIQLEQFRAISRLPSPPSSAYPARKPSHHPLISSGSLTQRRSTQSKRRVAKMRRAYAGEDQTEKENDLFVRPTPTLSPQNIHHNSLSHSAAASAEPNMQPEGLPAPLSNDKKNGLSDPEDEEAHELYEWTRGLNFDDINKGMFPTNQLQLDSTPRSVSFSSRLSKRVFAS